MGRQKANKKWISYKSNSCYEPEVFCASFDGWMQARRDGDKRQMERCINEIYDYLRDFIYYTLRRHFPQEMAHEDACAELVQNYWLEVLKALPGYDYHKSRITTYLAPYAHSAGRAYYRQFYHTTGYYAEARSSLEKAANILRLEGEEPDTDTLAQMTGLSKLTVKRVYEEMQMDDHMCSLETGVVEIDSTLLSQEGNPEKTVLQQELKESFGRFQRKMSGEEAFVLGIMKEMEEKGYDSLSCWKIRIYLDEKKEKDLTLCTKKYSCCKLKGIKQRIGKKLLWDKETRDYSYVYKNAR